ncbi:hypothetical protein CALCODRAFT_108077 [Calocera cornea HHB12733]|uniref:Uncharacterized protein n=1 Tax=Calocera cornea HHB12733 TaxID=1353952 RepID=A0A165IGP0_9BASI|nr:hypothetical protein CALCODRAFT_108077 [Calocera cornea HHB12733]
MYGFPDQAMGGRQSAETYRPGQAEQRLSLVVPPAHAISATFIPDSRLLPLRERAGTPTQHQMQLQHQQQQQQQLQMQQQEQQRQQQQQQQPRPQSRQQIQPPPEDDGSDSEDHGALIVHENAPRNSMSFPTSTPPPQHPHPHPQHRQQHPHAHPHQPQTPVRTRTVSSSTPSRRQSKHIPLPSTQSDLGPRGPPPAVQISGSPLTGSLPRPRPSAYGTQRRPSSQSLDSYELPTRQNKKRGFFGTIAHALHLGGGGRDGRESPPFGDRSGSGWGKKDRSGGGGGWNTRTDRRIRDMHGWRGESSDEDVSALVTVENPRAAGGARPALDQRWGSESPHASGGGDGRRKAPPAGLTRGASVANGSGSTPTRSPSQRRVVEQQRALSPQEVLESRLDAAARTRTMSTPGAGAGAGIGAGVGVGGMPGGGARQQEGFTRLRTISEASGTGNRRSVHESAGAGAGTPGRAGGQHAAGLARSGTGRSAMSTATAPPGGASAPGAALSRSGTTRSSMSAPPNSAPGAAGAKKKPLPSASASARQQHRMSGAPSGGPNILSVLDENEGGAGGGGGVGKGLVEIKAPPRVLRDPADGLISVKAPAPATTMLPLSGPPAPAPQSAQPTKAQQTPRPNGASSLARNLSTSTSASTAHGHTAAANNNLSRNLSTSTSASSAHVRPQRAQPPPATTLHPSSALAASASGATAGSHSSGSSTGVGGQYVHHTPVPSARAPMPIKSALRTRSPSPEPPRPIIALPPPAPIAQQPPAPAPAAPMSPATPVATAAALPTEAQPRPQPPDGLKPRPASAATFGTSGDDASAYETGLEEMEDSGSESAYSGTPGQGTPRLGTVPLEEEQSTPIAVRAMPPFVPSPVVPPAPQPVTQQGENDSGVSESTAVASDKPTRRKSVRLDVPPSLTPTPAAEDFPEDPWKVSMDELANAKPSRSYLSTPPAPAKSSSTHGSQPSPQRGFQLHDRPPPPEKGPALDGEDPEDGGWHMRASSGDSSDEEDGEYARAKRELEEANKRYAQAGHLRRR